MFVAPLRLARGAQAAHHKRFAGRKSRDLFLPLVLQRGRADHQHALHAEVARHQFGGGDRLHRLAQAHLVGDQCSPGSRGEQRAFGLVRVQARFQQRTQAFVRSRQRVGLGEQRGAPIGIAQLRDELERVVVDAQFMAEPRSRGDEGFERVEAIFGQAPVVLGVEQLVRARHQFGRAVGSRLEAHVAPAAVLQVHFAEGRRKAARERGLAAAPLGEFGERELDMLARAEVIGRVVEARAVVVAGREAADHDAVTALAHTAGADPVFGEHRLIADVVQLERLLAAELAAQRKLPRFGGHAGRTPVLRQARRFGLDLLASRLGACAALRRRFGSAH